MLDAQHCRRPPIVVDEKLLKISASLLCTPSKSLLQLAQVEGIGLATVHNVVRQTLKLIQNKLTVVQKLPSTIADEMTYYQPLLGQGVQKKGQDSIKTFLCPSTHT